VCMELGTVKRDARTTGRWKWGLVGVSRQGTER